MPGPLMLTYNHETRSLRLWARRANLKPHCLWERLYRYGWDMARALEEPVQRHRTMAEAVAAYLEREESTYEHQAGTRSLASD
jgi:hypothetical protein